MHLITIDARIFGMQMLFIFKVLNNQIAWVYCLQQFIATQVDSKRQKIEMNRIKLTLIKQTTSISVAQLAEIIQCSPYSQGYLSQKFPIYPITICLHLTNPPFNRISLAFNPAFLPSSVTIEGSGDSKQYFKINSFAPLPENPCINVLNLKEEHHYNYLRLRLSAPQDLAAGKLSSQSNVCRQVSLKAVEVTFVSFYGCEYVCSLEKALVLDPVLFRVLEILEYKSILAKNKGKSSARSEHYRTLSLKYQAQIQQLLASLKKSKQSFDKLSPPMREKLIPKLQTLISQPLQFLQPEDPSYNKPQTQEQVSVLQSELADFYITRLNALHKDVTDYFGKYRNREVKEQYLRMLSSPENEDHGKALSNFWGEVKNLGELKPHLEEAIVMFFNYFLEYTHDPLKITAIKILCLLFQNPSISYDIYFVYERLLFNLYSQLADEDKKQLFSVALKCIFILFKKTPDNLFIQALLNPEHTVKFRMKIVKLEILEKITFRNVAVDARDRDAIIDFLLDVLSFKQITLEDKNRAYNVIAYLASVYSKEPIMARFEKLNAMLLMSLQKTIDKKLSLLSKQSGQPEAEVPSCEYCGVSRPTFADPNLYDLHCFKQCKYLAPCKYCSQVVQIPQLPKHYIHDCNERNLFKQCQDCMEVIVKAKEAEHAAGCGKTMVTRCGLCGEKQANKLRLKQHILKDGCPNNTR